jgi:hypothetical protein
MTLNVNVASRTYHRDWRSQIDASTDRRGILSNILVRQYDGVVGIQMNEMTWGWE